MTTFNILVQISDYDFFIMVWCDIWKLILWETVMLSNHSICLCLQCNSSPVEVLSSCFTVSVYSINSLVIDKLGYVFTDSITSSEVSDKISHITTPFSVFTNAILQAILPVVLRILPVHIHTSAWFALMEINGSASKHIDIWDIY